MVLILAEEQVIWLAGWPQLAILAFSLLLSALLLNKKEASDIDPDDYPRQYASRGSYIPLVLGRRRVGGVVCWVQPESSAQLQLSGGGDTVGKGLGGAPRSPSYSESAVHLICIGPGAALHKIYQNGKPIFDQTITPYSNPSGSTVRTSGEGDFRIYWGFPDDPVSSMMGAASNHGSILGRTPFATRYPNVVRIEWDKKLLGSTPLWPRLEYEIEVHPHLSSISKSRKLIVGNATFDEPKYNGGNNPVRQRIWSVPDNLQPTWNPREECEIIISSAEPVWGVVPTGWRASNDVASYFPSGSIIFLYGETPMYSANIGNIRNGAIPSGTVSNVTLNSNPRNLGINYMGGAYSAGPPTIRQGVAYWVTGSEYFRNPSVFAASGFDSFGNAITGNVYLNGFTRIRAKLLATGIDFEGTAPWSSTQFGAQAVAVLGNDGVNPAYVIDQLMFSPFPWGAGLSRKFFDMNSLEDLGKRVGLEGPEEDRVAANIEIANGQEADSALADILQDLGCLLSWSPEVGRYRFELVRETSETVVVPDDAILDPLPEIEVLHGMRPSERIAFTYKSRLNNYRDLSIQVGDEGQADLIEQANTKKISIRISTDFASARNVALRRQLEVTNNSANVRLRLARNSTLLYPGQQISVPKLELDTALRVMSIKRDTLSSEVTVSCLMDHYGVPALGAQVVLGEETIPPRSLIEGLEADWYVTASGTPTETLVVPNDTLFAAFELPRALTDGMAPVLTLAHARTFPAMIGSEIWGSRDQSVYRQLGSSADFWTPLVLTEDMEDAWEVDQGPLGTILGLDGLSIENLSDPAMEESWRAGRQILVLTDGVNTEICYLRSADLLVDNGLRLRGVIRARLGTAKRQWPIGTVGWVALSHAITKITDPLLQPGKSLYLRAQPFTTTKALALGEVAPALVYVSGISMKPATPGSLRTTNHRNGWRENEDLSLRWEFATPDKPLTGAGQQDFGTPHVYVPPEGRFLVKLIGSSSTVVLETEDPFLVYTYAQIQNKFPGEETIDVSVQHVDGVLASEPALLTVTKLS